MITKLKKNELINIEHLFQDWDETLIWSCLQGCMGQAWTDNNFQVAQIIIGDFFFFAGNVELPESRKLLQNIPKKYNRPWILIIPKDESWNSLIEKIYAGKYKSITRHAIKKEPDVFNKDILQKYIDIMPKTYSIATIDESLYHITKAEIWSRDFCSQFSSYDEYKQNGLGFAILFEGKPVCGASSYTYYNGGIEIEISTLEEHRRKGLATACAAKLILECMKRNIYPSWDAANRASVALAEKLGYHFDHEYTTYAISRN